MKRGDRQLFGLSGLTQQFAHPLAHYECGFVSKCQRRDVARLIIARLNQVHDFLRNDARLARSGACQYKARAIDIVDGDSLRSVETVLHGGVGVRQVGERVIVSKVLLPSVIRWLRMTRTPQ